MRPCSLLNATGRKQRVVPTACATVPAVRIERPPRRSLQGPTPRESAVSAGGRWMIAGWLVLLASGCGDPSSEPAALPSPATSQDAAAPASIFTEMAGETGLDFVQFNGMSGEYYMAEVTGSGGALFDYDNDGDLDVYLIQGTLLGPGKTLADASFAPRYPEPLTDRLYRNDLDRGELSFTDVTEASGLTASDYGMGVTAGDYDNDGWVDLYVTNFGPNRMLRNNGPGETGVVTFTEVTQETGTEDPRWSVPAIFIDYDRDGWLDLFVGNYIAADLVHRQICRDFVGAQDYCGPGAFDPEPDRLFRNRGGDPGGPVSFVDVSAEVGLRGGFGAALGVIAADFNGDRLIDFYVTNDSQANNLWIQKPGDGRSTFVDEALLAGCSVNSRGKAEASMGVDAADFDGDGDLDLFMTHLTGQTNTLYTNDGHGLFDDRTIDSGLSAPSRPYTSFGTAWFDWDNDGWLDLLIANGAVKKIEALARLKDPFPVHQPNQLFHNRGDGSFEDATARGGSVMELSEVSRGAAFGDVDNDGDTDVLMINNNGPVRLMINQLGNRQHWLGARLVIGDPPRDGLGALVALERTGQPTLWRRVRSDGSYCSANDPRVLFGLGADPTVDRLRVLWPDGSEEAWTELGSGRYNLLRQGEGESLLVQ